MRKSQGFKSGVRGRVQHTKIVWTPCYGEGKSNSKWWTPPQKKKKPTYIVNWIYGKHLRQLSAISISKIVIDPVKAFINENKSWFV